MPTDLCSHMLLSSSNDDETRLCTSSSVPEAASAMSASEEELDVGFEVVFCGGGAGGVRTVRRGGADRAAGVRRGCRQCGGVRTVRAARAAGVRGGVRTLRRGVGADFLAAALRGARGFERSSAAARVPCGNGVGRTPLVSCRNPCTSGSGRARCTWPFRRSFALSGVMPQV